MRERVAAVGETEPRQEVPHWRFLGLELALAAVIASLSLAVHAHPGPLPGDVGLELDVQHGLLPHPWVSDPLEAISTLNFPGPALLTLAAVLAIFALLRRWLDILIVAVALGITNGSALVLSQIVHRPRPTGHGIHIISMFKSTFSFPSGHVTYAVCVFGMLLYLTYQVRRPVHPVLIMAIRVLLIGLILAMPVSRVLEGAHWPSDVLGGILYGAFWLALLTHAYIWARNKWSILLAPDER